MKSVSPHLWVGRECIGPIRKSPHSSTFDTDQARLVFSVTPSSWVNGSITGEPRSRFRKHSTAVVELDAAQPNRNGFVEFTAVYRSAPFSAYMLPGRLRVEPA
jgi:hypothetical protein